MTQITLTEAETTFRDMLLAYERGSFDESADGNISGAIADLTKESGRDENWSEFIVPFLIDVTIKLSGTVDDDVIDELQLKLTSLLKDMMPSIIAVEFEARAHYEPA